jgi:GGDEF domain-containing protein
VAQTCYNLFAERLLTASVGLANYPGDGSDAEQLLAEADRRMYTQKRDRKQAAPELEHRRALEIPWDVTTVQ